MKLNWRIRGFPEKRFKSKARANPRLGSESFIGSLKASCRPSSILIGLTTDARVLGCLFVSGTEGNGENMQQRGWVWVWDICLFGLN